ncbi:unnamed protein product, partial [Larinioides sclopetarius]
MENERMKKKPLTTYHKAVKSTLSIKIQTHNQPDPISVTQFWQGVFHSPIEKTRSRRTSQ